jgi:hypothetical protein
MEEVMDAEARFRALFDATYERRGKHLLRALHSGPPF